MGPLDAVLASQLGPDNRSANTTFVKSTNGNQPFTRGASTPKRGGWQNGTNPWLTVYFAYPCPDLILVLPEPGRMCTHTSQVVYLCRDLPYDLTVIFNVERSRAVSPVPVDRSMPALTISTCPVAPEPAPTAGAH